MSAERSREIWRDKKSDIVFESDEIFSLPPSDPVRHSLADRVWPIFHGCWLNEMSSSRCSCSTSISPFYWATYLSFPSICKSTHPAIPAFRIVNKRRYLLLWQGFSFLFFHNSFVYFRCQKKLPDSSFYFNATTHAWCCWWWYNLNWFDW